MVKSNRTIKITPIKNKNAYEKGRLHCIKNTCTEKTISSIGDTI